ncbi:MAG TPA: GMC family oxidoreductase N-terminal domain-containing protein [Dongiaceae bacterium]|jgi:choline dehydrogenase|nr:GMC family oxidoreductase N-terminal domain-containing protein [Dongiaceae bacterium]
MEADYVIVGAGSAGCVLADRLSAGGARVILLEAGPKDRNPMIHIPAGAIRLRGHPVFDWNYTTEPEPETGNRAFKWARGRVLGGTGSINGMNYVRGNPVDFDTWAQMGCRGWSYGDVLPYFKSIEDYEGGDPRYRGRSGPMRIEDYRTILPITHRFVEAARQAGFRFNPDINGEHPAEGVGYSQMSRKGRFRASTAQAFLRRATGRPNLTVLTGAHVLRLLFEGKACTGVAIRRNGAEERIQARREVVLSAGAINSPQILQLSGVGAADHLRGLGIEVVHNLPGVGENLSDHYAAPIICEISGLETVNDLGRGVKFLREVARWVVTGRGALTFGATTVSVFCRSGPEVASPDLQLLFFPGNTREKQQNELSRFSALRLSIAAVRPASRGTVMVRSSDPFVPPAIHPHYLTAPEDLEVLLAGVKIGRDILKQPAIAGNIIAERSPGPGVVGDDDLKAWIRDVGRTVYHPVGTCRMGENDERAVVDSRLRLHGIARLRVADASIMPNVTTGNTNAPTIMIAEKAAAMILEDNRS